MGKPRGSSLQVRQRQDGACGGIGKRRLVRLHLWKGTRKGKRRQHGGQQESEHEEEEALDPYNEGAPDIPVYADIPYTRREQCSPGRDARGRRRLPGKDSKKQRGMSLYTLLHGPDAERRVFEWCVQAGFLLDARDPDIRPYPCPKCGQRVSWNLSENRSGDGLSYECPRPCRYREAVTACESDLFLPRVALRCCICLFITSSLAWKRWHSMLTWTKR